MLKINLIEVPALFFCQLINKQKKKKEKYLVLKDKILK